MGCGEGEPMITKYNRMVYFLGNKCVGVGLSGEATKHDWAVVLPLPSDHYDFAGPVADEIKGKEMQEVKDILAQHEVTFEL
jgi:hypothetical protein